MRKGSSRIPEEQVFTETSGLSYLASSLTSLYPKPVSRHSLDQRNIRGPSRVSSPTMLLRSRKLCTTHCLATPWCIIIEVNFKSFETFERLTAVEEQLIPKGLSFY